MTMFLQTTLSQILNSSSQASSGYQSNFTGSSVSLDTQNISGKIHVYIHSKLMTIHVQGKQR